MSTNLPTAEPAPTTSTRAPGRLHLSFNQRVSFDDGPDGAKRGLRDGIALIEAAERLGYQSSWAYQRHFDNYLSSPLPFFAAAGQRTGRITLGSAVIPMRYQDPVLLAEAAGTTDLLVDGRLRLTLSSGRAGFEPVFGHARTDARAEGQRRLLRFLAAVEGRTLHTVREDDDALLRVGSELRVTPHSDGLRDRIAYGSGHVASARDAAAQRLRLMTGTILHSADEGRTFPEYQAEVIAAYRAAWPGPDPAPPVTVAASILPATTPELAAKYEAYDLQRRTEGPAASRPRGALVHDLSKRPADLGSLLVSPVFRGDPDAIVEALLADPGIQAADEIALFLPPAFGLDENVRVLRDMAAHVGPALGWTPAT
ncbi:LLM class flavin-dependent oxidoreductase [Patulibacter sp. NPDC049589]|uniref:LLM class flavin-dependent oxidoreductase n=1 Tax=Patulibacter sp. NPDC049589 TaxID=3154731 RepID=UPI00341C1B21